MSARTIKNLPLNEVNEIFSAGSTTNLYSANITVSGFVNGNNLTINFISDSTGSTGTAGQVLTVAANGKVVWATPA